MNNDLLDNDLLDDIKPAKTVVKKVLSTHEKIQKMVFYATIVKWVISGSIVIGLAYGAYWAASNAKDIVADAIVPDEIGAAVEDLSGKVEKSTGGWGDKLKTLSVKVVSEVEEYKNEIATGEEITLHEYKWTKFAWPNVCPATYAEFKKILNTEGKVTETQHSRLTMSCGDEANEANIVQDRIEAEKLKKEILGE
jgi:hypothetical protein